MVAFFLNEASELEYHGLESVNNYVVENRHDTRLFDYEGYKRNCEYTGEKVKTLYEFIKEKEKGSISMNTYLNTGNTILVSEQQESFYESIEGVSSSVSP